MFERWPKIIKFLHDEQQQVPWFSYVIFSVFRMFGFPLEHLITCYYSSALPHVVGQPKEATGMGLFLTLVIAVLAFSVGRTQLLVWTADIISLCFIAWQLGVYYKHMNVKWPYLRALGWPILYVALNGWKLGVLPFIPKFVASYICALAVLHAAYFAFYNALYLFDVFAGTIGVFFTDVPHIILFDIGSDYLNFQWHAQAAFLDYFEFHRKLRSYVPFLRVAPEEVSSEFVVDRDEVEYRVELNGAVLGRFKCPNVTLTSLRPNTMYRIRVLSFSGGFCTPSSQTYFKTLSKPANTSENERDDLIKPLVDEKELQVLLNEVQAVAKQRRELESQLADLERSHQSEIDQLQSDIKHLQRIKQEDEADVEHAKEKLRLKQYEKIKRDLEHDLHDQQMELEYVRNDYESTTDDISAFVGEIECLQKETGRITKVLKDEESQLKVKDAQHIIDLERLEGISRELQIALNSKQREIDQLTVSQTRSRTILHELRHKNDLLRAQIEAHNKELNESTRKNLETKKAGLLSELMTLKLSAAQLGFEQLQLTKTRRSDLYGDSNESIDDLLDAANMNRLYEYEQHSSEFARADSRNPRESISSFFTSSSLTDQDSIRSELRSYRGNNAENSNLLHRFIHWRPETEQ